MTRPRKELISIDTTPYYHITSRCVRRTYLCGIDSSTNISYEHRRQWIVDRIRLLSSIFAIDIAAYAVMSNHYHLVIKLSPEHTKDWTTHEVIERWRHLYSGSTLVQRLHAQETLKPAELASANETIEVYRHRLGDISWFMKCLNEYIAREANKEDNCTGHFWESRYKSQALLTEEALVSAMAYVDLNPVRAAMAPTPEDSDYTSIQERITPQFNVSEAISRATKERSLPHFLLPLKPLLHFDEAITQYEQAGIPFGLSAYIELVDWTGKIIRDDKRGFIDNALPPILDRLSIDKKAWLQQTTQFEQLFQKRFARLKTTVNLDNTG